MIPLTHYELNQMDRQADVLENVADVYQRKAKRRNTHKALAKARAATAAVASFRALIAAARREADTTQQQSRGVAA